MREGLTSSDASARLRQFGPNEVLASTVHPWLALVAKLWAPVPWMLEGTIGLEMLLGRRLEALVFTVLLAFNALLSFFQENRAQRALALLRQRLTVQARVRRDGRWALLPARDLVPGDVVRLRAGDLVPADVKIFDGQLLVNQAALTGEALPVDIEPKEPTYAGSIVQRGEATGEVIATGARTSFGKTVDLVRTAKAPGHLATLIARIVRYLVAFDLLLVVGVLTYGLRAGIPLAEIMPFALIILIASIPVALPATFTLATTLGSMELTRQGVLVARLSAIEEAAEMDVLCVDKTGTLTQNQPTVFALSPYPPHSENALLQLAALGCDEATHDPIDLAILAAARQRQVFTPPTGNVQYIPFDPATKRSGAIVHHHCQMHHILKGARQVIVPLVRDPPDQVVQDAEALGRGGSRVLAVAAGPEGALELIGLIALHDPPRPDSKTLVQDLRNIGIRMLMVTGDSLATAEAIGRQVGLGSRACPPEVMEGELGAWILEYDIFARVLPEGKFRLVQALQKSGHVVGMTGDGVNDAPALKQAEVGIAVATATDVAKAAASLVLTSPGLANIVSAVKMSRRIHQRMLTYTLNKIAKTFEISLLLSLGLLLVGVFVTTPLLIVLLLFANDFVTMSIATDEVSFGRTPDRWDVRSLALAALSLAAILLVFSFGVVYVGWNVLRLPIPTLQTMVFLWMVFSGQATVYLVRERRNFWRTRPGWWLIASTLGDVLVVGSMAIRGWLMTPISLSEALALLGVSLTYLLSGDFIKPYVFRRLGLH